MKTFADRLKYAMAEAKMNQTTLAQKSGASNSAISQYLSGKTTPGADRVKLFADITGVPFDYLMGYTETEPEPPVPVKRITIRDAARCLGKAEQFIRVGLQMNILPFGNAVPGTGDNWSYYINPTKFRDYVGADRFNEYFGLTA